MIKAARNRMVIARKPHEGAVFSLEGATAAATCRTKSPPGGGAAPHRRAGRKKA
ncbi:hypothetical protein ACFVVQ_14080 [Paenibacillus chitinolyticus]|uniref:hypothetical protein n=1 Tax=Paenibacillus chitinolyticus TaxID=79263 RepID=UPI0036DC4646